MAVVPVDITPFANSPAPGNMWNLRFDELESRNLENQQVFVQNGDLLRTIKLIIDLVIEIDQVTGNSSSLYVSNCLQKYACSYIYT